MSNLTLDPATAARLLAFAGLVEVRDQEGRVLGYFQPVGERVSQARSPLAQEELARRRLQHSGKPLAEVLANLPQT